MPGPSVADVWRIYTKPSMKGRLIFRKKTVNRVSEEVIARNKTFGAKKAASACKGKKWDAFVACLRDQFRK